MALKQSIHRNITIGAPPSKVWKALIDVTGGGESLKYADKGKIIHIIPQKLLHIAYPNGTNNNEGIRDYYHIIYELEAERDITTVRISQENIEDEKELKQIEEAWGEVLLEMKKLLETKGR